MAYFYLGDKKALHVRSSGLRILLDVEDIGIINFVSTDVYEPDVSFAIEALLEKDGVFVDVGANLGIHSLSAAMKLAKPECVIAVEPNPELFGLMTKSIIINGYQQRISTHNIAAWNQDVELELSFPSDAHRVGAIKLQGSQSPAGNSSGTTSFPVKGRRIDDVIKDKERVCLIKIDVEGREPYVIEGLKETITKSNCAIIAEFVGHDIERLYGLEKFLQMMDHLGLKPHRVDAKNKTFEAIETLPSSHANLVWKRR
ncbi:MAG: FkbM family methyltransferase [Roseibium sp.]|uniref:FkbM family methyltransferase n=1 Tax=Roseibium sp. TaxID=1936156 RepID=UPI003D9C347A